MSKVTQQERNGLFELTSEARADLAKSKYFNDDLAPTTVEQRNWSTKSITNLWIGMSICIPSLSLASSLIGLGVSPLLSVLNVILGNLIVLIPIQLNSQIGTKYGIPFPIFSRLVFGNKGAQLPTIARSIVACGWTSVQAWVGGGAIAAIIGVVIPSFADPANTVAMPGNPAVQFGQLIGFFLFMALVFWVAYNGLDQVKWVQDIGGPILVVVILLLGYWSVDLLKEAGYENGVDIGTFLVAAVGDNEQVAQMLVNMWSEVGITAKIEMQDSTTASALSKGTIIYAEDGKTPTGATAYQGVYMNPSQMVHYQGNGKRAIHSDNFKTTVAKYWSDELDSYLEKAQAASTDKERDEWYQEVCKFLNEESVNNPIYYTGAGYAWAQGLNVVLSPYYILPQLMSWS